MARVYSRSRSTVRETAVLNNKLDGGCVASSFLATFWCFRVFSCEERDVDNILILNYKQLMALYKYLGIGKIRTLSPR